MVQRVVAVPGDSVLGRPSTTAAPTCTKICPYAIRQTTTAVPVEVDVAGGALPMSAGTSFHGRRKPNWIGVPPADHGRGPGGGEARDERDVAVEVLVGRKAPANRQMLHAVLVAVFAAALLATRLPSR